MTEEKILDRVRKMLALANDAAASEGERDNALRMAHNLLVKYNLSMTDVERKTREAEDPRGRESFTSWSQPWARDVFDSVGRLFFCKYLYGGKLNATKMVHWYVGRASNATTAVLIGEYVVASILAECRRRYMHNLAPESRAFATGASVRIAQRVQSLIRDKQEEVDAVPGTALVLADLYRTETEANSLAVKEFWPDVKTGKDRTKPLDEEAARHYHAGKAYGETVSLHTQVEGKRARKTGHKELK